MPSSSQHREFAPPASLRDAVKCFWHNRRDGAGAAADFEVLPDGYAEIVFHFGAPCSIARGDAWAALPSPFMMGLLDRPLALRAPGRLDVLGVRCYPWAAFDLLGLPSGPGDVHVFQHPIAQLQVALARDVAAGRIEAAVARLARCCLDLHARAGRDSVLARAGTALVDAHGTIPVSAVAAAAHATVRTLERRFRQASGRTVKAVSSLMRFEQVRNRLFADPDAHLAALAQELGYVDQSHLSREFRRYSGTTPGAFAHLQRVRRAAGSELVVFVQA